MLEDIIEHMEKLEQQTHIFETTIDPDVDGYLDRECPNKECTFQFKVFSDDWSSKNDEGLFFCAFCRHQAPKEQWHTIEQLEEGERQATEYFSNIVEDVLHQGLISIAEEFNQSQDRNSLIKINMSVEKGSRVYVPTSIQAKEAFELKLQCEQCQTKFAVIGSAFFCPCCGHNSAEQTMDDALRKVHSKLEHLHTIKEAVSKSSKDQAVLVVRSIIESCLSDCVVAFQRFCEVMYQKNPRARANIPLNCFQRLQDGSNLWKEILSEGYDDWLTAAQAQQLNLFFQRRHLLQHCEGMVNDKYIQKSGDCSYQIGQRIVVKPDDVLVLVTLIEILTKNIREKI